MPEHDDDATQAMPPSGEQDISDDELTREIPIDEPAHLMPSAASNDATSVMPTAEPEAATKRMPAVDDAASTRIISRSSGTAPPATERIMLPARNGSAAWLVALAIVIGLLVGAAVGYTGRTPADSNVVARALVGADGGVLTFDGAGSLTVPSNALATATAITIRRERVDRRIRLGPLGDPRSVTYEPGELTVYVFEPAELRFQQAVTIELPDDGDGTAVFVDDTQGSPRVIPGEPGNGIVRVDTTSFRFESE